MSIQQLTQVEEKFTRNLRVIRNEAKELPKAQKLRITAWLKKLCSIVDNQFWRKNRNLYTEVLAIMLQSKMLESPFDKFPPETSLPKINLYEIPFWIRQKLEDPIPIIRNNRSDKQNQNTQNMQINDYTQKIRHIQSTMSDLPKMRMKKKQSYQFKSMQGTQIPASVDMRFITGINNEEQASDKGQRQQITKRYPKKRVPNPKSRNIVKAIQKSLLFLAKNHKVFESREEYKQIISQIIEYGDQVGANFRQMKFSIICD